MNKFKFSHLVPLEVIGCPTQCNLGDISSFQVKTWANDVEVDISHTYGLVEALSEKLDEETFLIRFVPRWDGVNWVNISCNKEVKTRL